ncbi:replication initiation protein [Paraclostridium sordellii]|uniref:replication initiation protein n=1 Tax=Paraclostridium sordellii TaxID=1505 RepID=UPI0005DCE5B4|nr:replication initiation protein [Paeniclostridium sordellii]CEN77468.1 putative replication initiator protein [[Clostridium] sordellii] [Paeniclostridium sordellii]
MSKKEILMQPNNLIKSKYDFSNIENKLFYKLLFNAQKNATKSLYETNVSLDELKQFMKNNNNYVHSGVKEILNLFQQSILEFEYIDDTLGRKLLFSSGLVTSYFYDSEKKEYIVQIHEVLHKHITDFVKMQQEGLGYTALNLSVLFNFRGAYSQRMYTFLRMWSRQNKEVEVKYSIEDLRSYLKIRPDIYPAYKNFKQKVIKKSIEEINKIGNMKVEIKDEIKKGRKVDQIVFSVIDYEPRKYFDKSVVECEKNENNNVLENIEPDKSTNTLEDKKECFKMENKEEIYNSPVEFFIPDESIFTIGTLRLFKKDFGEYDFKISYMNEAFEVSAAITMEQDNTEIIETKSYKFFKGTLNNKIKEYKDDYEKDLQHKKEMDKYW